MKGRNSSSVSVRLPDEVIAVIMVDGELKSLSIGLRMQEILLVWYRERVGAERQSTRLKVGLLKGLFPGASSKELGQLAGVSGSRVHQILSGYSSRLSVKTRRNESLSSSCL